MNHSTQAMNQDLSIVTLLLHASFVVQLVVLLLVGISIASWAAIFRKFFALKRMRALNDDFEREFWSGTSLNELFSAAAQNAKLSGPMERIFASGSCTRSCPSNMMLPEVTRPLPGSRPMQAIAVVDLPEPDSPTMATVSPGNTSKLTPRTAGTMPSAVWNPTSRF